MDDYAAVMDAATAETIRSPVFDITVHRTETSTTVKVTRTESQLPVKFTCTTANGAVPVEAVGTNPMFAMSITSYSTMKARSRALLRQIWNETNAGLANFQTFNLLYTYSGYGLHPLAAIKAIARFPTAVDSAINFLFEMVQKAASRFITNPSAFHKSLRGSSGNPNRYLKAIDQLLARIVCTRWLSSMSRGGEWEWNPIHINSRIYGCGASLFGMLCIALPETLRDKEPAVLAGKASHFFSTSKPLLRAAQSHRLAVMRVYRVAGHRLPPEVLDMIIDALHRQHHMFEPLKLATVHVLTNIRLEILRMPLPSGRWVNQLVVSEQKPRR